MTSFNTNYQHTELVSVAQHLIKYHADLWGADGMLHYQRLGAQIIEDFSVGLVDLYKIKVFPSNGSLQPLQSMLVSDGEGISLIQHCCTLNRCKKRFSVIKELCHLLIDPEFKDVSTDTESQAIEATQDLDWNNIPAEMAAFILAVEICLPRTKRDDIDNLRIAGANSFDIAQQFVIPEYIIEFYFKEFRNRSNPINELMWKTLELLDNQQEGK